jgi:hypothetical protein
MSENDRQIAPNTKPTELRDYIARLERIRDEQPARLMLARNEVELARKDALAAEPWAESCSAIPTYGSDGELSGMMAIPSIEAKELFGTRLAFDLLAYCDDEDKVADIIKKYHQMVKDRDHLLLVAFSALETIANYVVPEFLGIIEDQAANWDVRVGLADAGRHAWAARIDDLRPADADEAETDE